MTAILFSTDKDDVTFLKYQWNNLLSFYTSETVIKNESFQMLKEKYSEKGRFYHNPSHVKALLNLCESLTNKVQDYNAVRFAIWFHDVVYDTTRSDNEEESARVASEMLSKLQVNKETIECIQQMILATKTHSGRNLLDDAKLFLDMDLAILGTSEEIYKEYSKAIREEYSWASESMYRNGRKKILESFIRREKIYLTDEMEVRYEKKARENIINEINSLNA